jgi:FixJ family two-component response regulator
MAYRISHKHSLCDLTVAWDPWHLPTFLALPFPPEPKVGRVRKWRPGHGDIPMSVQAMKGGAIEFLTKPVRDQDLLDAIQLGLTRDRVRRENESALADLRKRFAALSPREREIMIHVARGRLSKQIAGDIGIAEATVKVHRSKAMRKMNARSLPEFGQMAAKLNLVPEKSQRA